MVTLLPPRGYPTVTSRLSAVAPWSPYDYFVVTKRLPHCYRMVTLLLPCVCLTAALQLQCGYPAGTTQLPSGYPALSRSLTRACYFVASRLPCGYPAVTLITPLLPSGCPDVATLLRIDDNSIIPRLQFCFSVVTAWLPPGRLEITRSHWLGCRYLAVTLHLLRSCGAVSAVSLPLPCVYSAVILLLPCYCLQVMPRLPINFLTLPRC